MSALYPRRTDGMLDVVHRAGSRGIPTRRVLCRMAAEHS